MVNELICLECGKGHDYLSILSCPCKTESREVKIARNKERIHRKLDELKTRIEESKTIWTHCAMTFSSAELFLQHIDECSQINSAKASPYEMACDDCGKVIEIILSFEQVMTHNCSCEVEKLMKRKDIIGVTFETDTSLILRFSDGREEKTIVDTRQLEMFRDYWKDKYQREVTEKEEEKQKYIEWLRTYNIYRFDTPYHIIGWPAFLILGSGIVYHLYNKNEKSKEITDPIEDIKDKFRKWRYNMICSVAFYIISFTLIKQAIDKWGHTYITSLVKWNELVTLVSISIPLGFLYIGDNIIISSLKTPLQRLGVKIENSPISEKEKKYLLSKTQEANESFKETFKRFGLTAIPSAIAAIIAGFNEKWAANVSYFIPLFYACLIIVDVQKKLDKIEKE